LIHDRAQAPAFAASGSSKPHKNGLIIPMTIVRFERLDEPQDRELHASERDETRRDGAAVGLIASGLRAPILLKLHA